MTDDIVTRLRDDATAMRSAYTENNEYAVLGVYAMVNDKAADEIERLRRALDLAVGELSTNDRYRLLNPEQLRQQLLDEAVRGE